jgi:hypothetical protein
LKTKNPNELYRQNVSVFDADLEKEVVFCFYFFLKICVNCGQLLGHRGFVVICSRYVDLPKSPEA